MSLYMQTLLAITLEWQKLAFNLNFYFQFGIEIKILYHDIRSKLAIKMGENAKNAGSAKKKNY